MSYEPTNWKTGDVVTSAKLNKLEEGVANNGAGFLKVTASYDDQTNLEIMDKTWQEIYDALANGEYVSLLELIPEQPFVLQTQIVKAGYNPLADSRYSVLVASFDQDSITYNCAAANDYPYVDTSGEPS